MDGLLMGKLVAKSQTSITGLRAYHETMTDTLEVAHVNDLTGIINYNTGRML